MLKKYREIERSGCFKTADAFWNYFTQYSHAYSDDKEYIIHPLIEMETDLEFSELDFLDPEAFVIYEILDLDK